MESRHSVQSTSVSYGGIGEIQKDVPNSRIYFIKGYIISNTNLLESSKNIIPEMNKKSNKKEEVSIVLFDLDGTVVLVEEIELMGDALVPATGTFDLLVKLLLEFAAGTIEIHNPPASAVNFLERGGASIVNQTVSYAI